MQQLIEENQQLAAKIKENEVTALKLQGAIETLEYYNPETMSAPPEEVDEFQKLQNKLKGRQRPLFNGINNLEALSIRVVVKNGK